MKRLCSSIFALVVLLLASPVAVKAQDVIISEITSFPTSCSNSADGSVSVTVTGGVGNYSYLMVKGALPVEAAGPKASNTHTFTGHESYNNYLIIISDESDDTKDASYYIGIEGPDPIVIGTATSTDITCNNADDGTILVTASGEDGNLVFDLTGPENHTNSTGIFTGLQQGDYTVEVSHDGPCPLSAVSQVLTISNPSIVSISVDAINNVACFGVNTGNISITPSGGVHGGGTGYTYSWTGPNGFTSTSEDISNLEAGSYSVTVFDGNMCMANAGPIDISEPTELTAILTGSSDVTCNGDNDGSANMTPGGGTGGYSYSWEGQTTGFISTAQNPVNLLADSYDFTLSDNSGCSKIYPDFVTIKEPSIIEASVLSTIDVTCPGGSDGSASISPSGGSSPYTFLWTGVSTGHTSTDQNPSGLPADEYDLNIIDANTCTQVITAILTITDPDPLTATINQTTKVSCFGGADGSADLTILGGTPGYTIEWSGTVSGHSSSGTTPNDLVADIYDVNIIDASACIQNFPGLVSISEPDDISVTVDNLVGVNCSGKATGAIDITPNGGTPSYTYLWSGPDGFAETTRNISDLEAGDYNLTITDAKLCSNDFIALATVISNTSILGTFVKTSPTCNGTANGAIIASISGGTPPYIYRWTGPDGFTADTKDISGLEPGSYRLTVTDDLGCEQLMLVQELSEPDVISASSTQVNVDCFGADNGSVDLSPLGGTAPYLFAWTGPNGFNESTEDISNLEPGAYSVTITDANACNVSFTDIVTITEPSEMSETHVKTDISCGGLSDGTIEVTINGGTQPYTFAWTGPDGFVSSDEDISGLAAGSYDLVLSDDNGCIMNYQPIASIIEPTPITATLDSQVDNLCYGDGNGSIKIDAGGGIAPLIFAWTNSSGQAVSSDEDPNSLLADTYSLTISDQNGCSIPYPDMVTITEPSPITTILTGTHITCFGDNDGTISMASSGGSGSYEYSKDGITYQPVGDFPGLTPGLYTIWTRDANLCIVFDTLTIFEPAELQVINDSRVEQIKCNGELTGSIAIDEVIGGVQPYSYSINNGTSFFPTSEFVNLPPDSYQTVVMDASGCTAPGSLNVITEPAELVIGEYDQDDISSCFDALEGLIQITGAGGSGSYIYTLNYSQSNSTGAFLNLPGGTHNLRIEDINECTLDTSVVILTPPEIVVDMISLSDVTGCSGDSTGSITISGSGGTGTITYSIDGINFLAVGVFNDLWAGNHIVTLRDDNDCTIDTIINLNEPAPVTATILKTDATYGNLGTIDISETSGGIPPYEYSIGGPGGPFSNQTLYLNLEVGNYHVMVRDGNGCPYEEIVEISDILPLDVAVNVSHITCFGESNGTIEMLPQDAEGIVEYSIDSGISFVREALFENLAPNTYHLVALDGVGKLFTSSVSITEPTEITLSEIITPAECNAFSETGAIDVTVSGGTPGYTYLWSDGSINEDRSGIAMGTYTLVSQDANGCTRTDIFSVNSLVSVYAYAGEDLTICPGSSIQLEAEGGHTPSWSPVDFLSDPDIANPMAIQVTENITYILTITEDSSAYGCFNTDTVSIEVYPQNGLEVTMDTFVVNGSSIQLEATGGPFSAYRWEPSTGLDNSIIPNPLATPQLSTSYTVYALNEYGCEESDSVYVEVIEDIMAYNVFSPNGDGINDFFDIKNADRFPDVVVEVYSRWGDLLFQARGYDDGNRWDGTARGKDAPLGTYYYVIIPYNGARPITGNVTIIR